MRRNPDLQGKPEPELRSAAFLDDPGRLGRILEENFYLEGRYLARQLPQSQKCRVPAVHCAPSCLKLAPQYTAAKRNQQVIESDARIAIALCNYRPMLPYVIARKMRGTR